MTSDAGRFHALTGIARDAIAAWLAGSPYTPPRLDDDPPHGVFVTLWGPDGQLRGCIGHIEPTCPHVSEEVATCAVLAAAEDPRFPQLTAEEVADVTLEVSVLMPPEPIADRSELDPARYGVVVTAGWRRGVLLPEVTGVDTVDDQIRIALRKGGIRPDEPWVASRFQVLKISE